MSFVICDHFLSPTFEYKLWPTICWNFFLCFSLFCFVCSGVVFFPSENFVAEFTSPLILINKEGVFFNELIIKIFQLELLQPEDKSLNAKCPNRQRICACKNDKWLKFFRWETNSICRQTEVFNKIEWVNRWNGNKSDEMCESRLIELIISFV